MMTMQILRDRRTALVQALDAIRRERSPYYVGEQYIADPAVATTKRIREIDRLVSAIERVDEQIEEWTAQEEVVSMWGDETDDTLDAELLSLHVVARTLGVA